MAMSTGNLDSCKNVLILLSFQYHLTHKNVLMYTQKFQKYLLWNIVDFHHIETIFQYIHLQSGECN